MDLEAHFGLMPFTGPQVLELGFTYRQWRRIMPQLTRVRYGVYVIRLAPDDATRHAQRVAAELLPRTDHCAFAGSAVVLLGLPNPYFRSWDRVQITLAGTHTRSQQRIVATAFPTVPTPWGDCTDLVATATTIAHELPLPQALIVTDAIARRMAGTEDRVELASERCRTEVRRQLTRYSSNDALRLANPAAEAPSESFYRGHMILRGYTDPACGVPIKGRSGKQYFGDLLVGRLVIEVDGETKYQSPADLYAEKTREDDMRATGCHFLRVQVKALYANPGAAMNDLDETVDEVRWLDRWTG